MDDMGATALSPVCGDYSAVLTAVKDAARRAKRGGLRPSLTAAARDGLGKRRSGRQDGLRSNNRMVLALADPLTVGGQIQRRGGGSGFSCQDDLPDGGLTDAQMMMQAARNGGSG